VLEVGDIHVSYGGIQALKGISFRVKAGQIVTLIGANGAGKSSILKTICGLVKAQKGSIQFEGREIKGLAPHWVTRCGITLVPEGRQVFANLSISENLTLGAYFRRDREGVEEDMEWIFFTFPRLKERLYQQAGTLSGGEQQMLALGRALMGRPRLLMLDEPSLGLSPRLVSEVFAVMRQIHARGTTILLVEQNANAALRLAHHAYVLETGRIVLEGSGEELRADPGVQEAYLGKITLM
jgi:branched-chain amino acid transport system ATP-binding protein